MVSTDVALVLYRTIPIDLFITENVKRTEGKTGKIRKARKETVREWESSGEKSREMAKGRET